MVKNLQVFAARALPGSRICTGCVPQCKPRVPQGSLSNSSILPHWAHRGLSCPLPPWMRHYLYPGEQYSYSHPFYSGGVFQDTDRMLGTEDDGTKSNLLTVCVHAHLCTCVCACVCMCECVCARTCTACRGFRCLEFLTRSLPSQQGQ